MVDEVDTFHTGTEAWANNGGLKKRPEPLSAIIRVDDDNVEYNGASLHSPVAANQRTVEEPFPVLVILAAKFTVGKGPKDTLKQLWWYSGSRLR